MCHPKQQSQARTRQQRVLLQEQGERFNIHPRTTNLHTAAAAAAAASHSSASGEDRQDDDPSTIATRPLQTVTRARLPWIHEQRWIDDEERLERLCLQENEKEHGGDGDWGTKLLQVRLSSSSQHPSYSSSHRLVAAMIVAAAVLRLQSR